ncbi:MAG: radical SAM family heme chaperone HemW [Bacteroidales bacterium]|nr:radical SAM family heme chaperone HemW [Bacteroidales bacterium]MCL2133415.1 radical SAM family heme chaperone HemW [Bacteroidales bacterium]
MKGVYIHIPFCKQRCAYCDFYSSASLINQEAMLQAFLQEIRLRGSYLNNAASPVTLYFGGGTPTVYAPRELGLIVKQVKETFQVVDFAELTVEANPDDLSLQYLTGLYEIGVNRLSIGIQSFNDEHLRRMKRRHTAKQAVESLQFAKEAGFENITIDLMYGLPQLSLDEWKATIEKALSLELSHLSAYHLTIEPRTLLGKQQQKGFWHPIAEEESEAQFLLLHQLLTQSGYEHYEVSNFARAGKQAIHNSLYWQQQPYIGIGPSAHSFNGYSRQWNVANSKQYLAALQEGRLSFEYEALTPAMRYNEYLLVGLRTAKGVNLSYIRQHFGEAVADYFSKQIQHNLMRGTIIRENDNYRIPAKHFFVSDSIIEHLFS